MKFAVLSLCAAAFISVSGAPALEAGGGDALAPCRLGKPSPLDPPAACAMAERWALAAVEDHDPIAEFNLGVLYARGRGVAKDYVEAGNWFRRAAENGNPTAAFNLGIMYAHGLGGLQDYVTAYIWLKLAAARGEPLAKEALENVAAGMSEAEVAAGERVVAQRRKGGPGPQPLDLRL